MLRELLVDAGKIGERQFGVDRLDVRDRVDCPRDVHDVVVGKAAHDVRDRVRFADIGQELIAKSLTLGRPRDEPRDVDEFHRRGNDARWPRDCGERVEPRVGDRDHADVGLDRAEGIILRGDPCLREGIEQRRLADVGQSHDAATQTHGCGLPASDGGEEGGRAGRVCSASMARSVSPEASCGQTASARSIASPISALSSRCGGCNT
jgi:hypothetical protein